jgi:cell division protein FtsB
MLDLLPLAIDTTTVRLGLLILTPLGGLAGAFFGIVKLMPERTAIVVDYQLKVIDGLRAENKRLAQTVAHLETRIGVLEDTARARG